MAKRRRKKKGGLFGTVLVLVIAAGAFLWQQEDYRQMALSWLDDTFHETTKDSSQSLSDGNAVQNVEGEAKIWYLDVGQADSRSTGELAARTGCDRHNGCDCHPSP